MANLTREYRLTRLGEAIVQALPDREKVNRIKAAFRRAEKAKKVKEDDEAKIKRVI